MNERFRVLPGVRAATVSDMPLVANWDSVRRTSPCPALPNRQAATADTSYVSVGPAFFETMQLPILLGRPIDSRDVDGAPLAAVVNEVFAKKYFPNQNPIGQHFGFGNSGGQRSDDRRRCEERPLQLSEAGDPTRRLHFLPAEHHQRPAQRA